MARISGVDLPREKRVEIGLTYIYGIGRSSSNRILAEAGVNPDTRVKDLTDDEVKKLATIIADTQVVEGDLRREIAMNIKRLQENWLLQRNPSQKEPSGSRAEDQDQRKNLQGTEKDCC